MHWTFEYETMGQHVLQKPNCTCHYLVDLFYQLTKRRSTNHKKIHQHTQDKVFLMWRNSISQYGSLLPNIYLQLHRTIITKCSIKHILKCLEIWLFWTQNKTIQTTLTNWLCSLFNQIGRPFFVVGCRKGHISHKWMQIFQLI